MAKITEFLDIILEGRDLTFDQAHDLLDVIFGGDVAEVQIAAFLAAMRVKKAAAMEIAGLAHSLREHAVRVETGLDPDTMIDTCGTGGASLKTFNLSTAAAFAAAGAGAYVAKHGNKKITSICGSADVLTSLGVNIAPGPDVVAECIKGARIGFMFAPMYHPAMKHVQPVRQNLDFRTAFNILGPLANPAGAGAQVIGVADISLMERIVETLKMLGTKRAMVVHSNGLDEVSTMGPTNILFLKDDGSIESQTLTPESVGMKQADYSELAGGDAETNAAIIRSILEGKEKGPKKDIVVLNAAAGIIVAGLAESFEEGIKKADEAIANGQAAECLEEMIKISNS